MDGARCYLLRLSFPAPRARAAVLVAGSSRSRLHVHTYATVPGGVLCTPGL